MPLRFVHTADLHLDSPLTSLALADPDLADLVGAATRTALARIVDLCVDEAVDALMIAGDLYDGGQTSMKTARFLAEQLRRLDEAGIPTFAIRGNHDALSRITRELVLPQSVHVFGPSAATATRELAGGRLAVHGVSFAHPHAPDSLLPLYPPPVPDAWNVGLMHTSLDGAPGHDPYAPCRLSDLRGMAYDYWALGHIHVRAEHPGRPHVVMPGCPQGRDMGETGAKSASLVTIEAGGAVTVEARPTALAAFERLRVRSDDLADWPALVARLGAEMGRARAAAAADHLVLRVVIEGGGGLDWQVRRDLDLLTAEAASAGRAVGDVWIEAVQIEAGQIEAGQIEAGQIEGGAAAAPGLPAGPLAELALLAGPEAALPEAVAAAASAIGDEVVAALPSELRDRFGGDADGRAALLERMTRVGAGEVLARLRDPEGGAA